MKGELAVKEGMETILMDFMACLGTWLKRH
jgi:hypothetical protein